MVDIDKKSYILGENNYYDKKYTKNQIVIGHTGRKDMRHYDGWLNRKNGKYKKTSHFTIDKDGTIYQHFNPEFYSDFIGVEQDKSNISISLVNEGWLKKDVLNNVYIDWLGHIYSNKADVTELSWRNKKYWMNYTDNQNQSLKALIEYLCNNYGIEKKCVGNCVYNYEIDLFDGITFRSNYDQEITDISPVLDMDLLNKI